MGKDRLGCFRPLTCIRRKKLMNVRTYTKVTGIYKVEEWDEPDSSNFEEIQEENLSKPDDVTTSKPRLASECGMKKASLRACSERGSEFDIQLSSSDQVRRCAKLFQKMKKLVMIKPTN